ncbi:phosphoribosylaminoimidazolesuccinocarboxamide synthase, partial [Pinisolibacter sp. MA2-2]|nr:phosphoribosylaminoimidazolesuccinocarboxamide synthase [Pinisolibacter aquiterrae]
WDQSSGDKLDKDRFRRDLGGMLAAYQEVARRLGILNDNGPANPGPAPVTPAPEA